MLKKEEINIVYRISGFVIQKNGIEVLRSLRFSSVQSSNRNSEGGRGDIWELSRKSRARLAFLVANSDVEWASMMTLTYHPEVSPESGTILKKQLNLFLTRLRKKFSKIKYLWFLEFTRRGVPHVHIICDIVPEFEDRVWLGECWAGISCKDRDSQIREKSIKVHSHAKCWEKVRKRNGAARYAVKYALKQGQKVVPKTFRDTGRFWGSSRDVKVGEGIQIKISKEKEYLAYEILSELLGREMDILPKYIFKEGVGELAKVIDDKVSN